MLTKIVELPRSIKQLILFLIDSILLIGVLLASFSLRLGYWFFPGDDLLFVIFCVPVIAIPIFFRFGLYRTIIRFIGFRALWQISQAVSLYALLWGILGFMSAIQGIPRSVILINWLLAIVVIVGSRMVARWILSEVHVSDYSKYNNVVIYGAGSAGRELSVALTQSDEYNPVALIDDSVEMHMQTINGIEVLSPDNLEKLINEKNIKEVLLAIPSLPRIRRRQIIDFLEPYPVVVRSLPSISDMAHGKVKIDDLLEIDIGDLLGREPVKPNEKL